ncbi:proline dehydrogenase family protein [Estrella lausannensis]|nr:bifunctional proline dehydrogenase/L-glutamate gamma-semialdehyde dehydrogenase [Estrella lausannensis]
MAHDLGIKESSPLLEKIKGRALTREERADAAVALAASLLERANAGITRSESKQQRELSKMMDEPTGKVFTTSIADQSFRPHAAKRCASQVKFLIDTLGVPGFLSPLKRSGLFLFKKLGTFLPDLFVPLLRKMVREETANVILPGEAVELKRHIERRTGAQVRVNLNHLGEAILGEGEARRRLQTYLDDLKKPEVEYISVKISSIFSQINLISWDDTIEQLAERLRKLYRQASRHEYLRPGKAAVKKFVNLDMEEYRDLHLTVELFKKVLDEEEFHSLSAGIVLQAYLPDSALVQKELTEWAKKRVAKGAAPIKIRIVKGANLAQEQVEAALQNWQQAPYTDKRSVDASFKEMVEYGLNLENARAVRIGIASHNIFDIAYAMVLKEERGVGDFVEFEMLEGMADHLRRVVQEETGKMLLYCPAATEEDFVSAVSYLVRRLDENTAPENFLRHSFGIAPGTPAFEEQKRLFLDSVNKVDTISHDRRRRQNRLSPPDHPVAEHRFENEANTDWSLRESREFLSHVVLKWKNMPSIDVPLCVGGREILKQESRPGCDPSATEKVIYRYSLAGKEDVEEALKTAESAAGEFSSVKASMRSEMLRRVAEEFRRARGDLIGVMMADGGKTPSEADAEVSEAIDFIEYYRRCQEEIEAFSDLKLSPKGTVLVTPPWNFPCAIPVGGIAAAIAAGNSVIFKPAPETVLVGWTLASLFWKAGVLKTTLQFIACDDEPVGSLLIRDPRVKTIILTGSTETARLFMRMRPGIDLMAETGGKNSIIVTAMADRDLAIRDIIHSAFIHAGQKCSACSLAILEAEVYDDPHFLNQLKDAASSLHVGDVWDLSTKVGPLIRAPEGALLKGLTQIAEGEEWLLHPKQDPENPRIVTPGIKIGVKEGSFTHKTEFFGPLLAVMRADNLDHAIRLANGTPYGLTAGLQSLDPREQALWEDKIIAGNLYVNRGITGAVVLRQPFGGTKDSCFGPGYKAGGPNYLFGFQTAAQLKLPEEMEPVGRSVVELERRLRKENLTEEGKSLLRASFANYAFYHKNYFNLDHDPVKLRGQDNKLRYLPRKDLLVRFALDDDVVSLLQVIGALLTVSAPAIVSIDRKAEEKVRHVLDLTGFKEVTFRFEDESVFIARLAKESTRRVRFVDEPSPFCREALAQANVVSMTGKPLANGRVELVKYLREEAISFDYHRYGNLGAREAEVRKPLP